MNSGGNQPVRNPCPLQHYHQHHQHHHHFFYVSNHCPFHGSISQPKNHSPSCSFSNSNHSSQFPVSGTSNPVPANLSLSNYQEKENFDDAEETNGLPAENDEEPIFVLTDEWREFFAKSEAKRRLAKSQVKKGRS